MIFFRKIGGHLEMADIAWHDIKKKIGGGVATCTCRRDRINYVHPNSADF